MDKPNQLPIPAWPPHDAAIDQSIQRLLANGSWGAYHGVATAELSDRLQIYFGSSHVRLCSSGTIGVEIALRAVGISADDEVILAAYDFPGNFRAIESIGAIPVLVDVAPDSHCIDPAVVEAALSTRTRGLLISHLHGQIAPLESLRAIAIQHNIHLIEDACQVPGGRWKSQPLGSFGDVGVLSFGGSKLLTAGRGGAILTNDPSVDQRARIFCERGNDAFPLSELQAAVLVPQVEKLDERGTRRQGMVRLLTEELRQTTDLIVPLDLASDSAYYKVPLLFNGTAGQRGRFLELLAGQGIDIGEGFRGFALRSRRRCRKVGPLANAQSQAARTCLLHHPVLLADEAIVRDVAARIASAATRSRSAG